MNKKEISEAAAILGRKGGQTKTPARAAASRENGKKGGKPPSITITQIDGRLDIPGLREGMSLRDALSILRAYPWGDIETGVELSLSDGTTIWVELKRCKDNSYLMSSQRAVRYRWEHGVPVKINTYKLR